MGSGVAGLGAAYHLKKQAEGDFEVRGAAWHAAGDGVAHV